MVEMWPGEGAWFAVKAEENAKIMRKVGIGVGLGIEAVGELSGVRISFHRLVTEL